MDISVKDLQEAISIRQQIDNLQRRLSSLLRGAPQTTTQTTRPTTPSTSRRYFSPSTRAKLSAAARARWARRQGTGTAGTAGTVGTVGTAATAAPAKGRGQ